MKLLRQPMVLAFVTSLVTLADWGVLGTGANFGLNPVFAIGGLLWLATLGLPTSIGVVLAASIWGLSEPLSGLSGFLLLAAALGIGFQLVTFFTARRLLGIKVSKGKIGKLSGVFLSLGSVGGLLAAGMWFTRPALTPPPLVIDGHGHLFGDQGWPPIHKRTSGLSPAQKANPTYRILTQLLQLPAQGDLDEAYVQALVRQVQEARQAIGSFRVVLLAQDCRYDKNGDPDWENSTVYVPNEHLFRVVSRYPDWFIPCPSINPERKDWEAELDYCLAQGARVLKIHPPTQGVNPSNPRFRAFYRKCAQSGMRIMFHTGAEHSAPIASSALGDPRLLELALEEGCTVIAAHAGTKSFFDPPAENHFSELVSMMARHPDLYADTAVLASMFRWRNIPEIVNTPVALPRLVLASDWPFPSNALVFWHRLHPFTLVRLMTEKNLFLRDVFLQRALGMPPEAFSRAAVLYDSKVQSAIVKTNGTKGAASGPTR